MITKPRIRILFYGRHPFLALGLTAALKSDARFQLLRSCDDWATFVHSVPVTRPDVLLVHLTSSPGLIELARLHSLRPGSPIALWGDDPGGDFGFQAMQLGVRAFLPEDTPVANLLTSLVSVHDGVLCFDRDFVDRVIVQRRITLTRREGQLVSLVAQGLKNKAIGARLGITEGTVKVYIYKLFKKLGVTDRLQMALYGRENLCAEPARGTLDERFIPLSLPVPCRTWEMEPGTVLH